MLNGMQMVKKEEECDFVDGKLNGYYIRWYEDGQEEECDYNGKKFD